MAKEVSEKEARDVAEAAREDEWKLPSFGKELFLGNFRLDLIHPQPELDPESVEKGERFLRELREVLDSEVDALAIERDEKLPDNVIDALKRIGALGMKVSEEHGGLGLSQVYYNRALMLAGSAHSSLGTLLSAHQSIGVAEPLRLSGSDEQKSTWLPKVAKDHISAFLLTEPDVGSDPARLSSTAVPTEDGSGYILNGRKLWATNGVIADVVVVMAQVPKSEGHKGGISCFILETNSEGVTVENRNRFMGLRGIENSATRLENVYVPKENVIGKEGEGLKIALTTLNTGRLALPAICVGVSKIALKIAREWSNERVQWGQAVGKHEAVGHKISFIAGTAFGLEAMLEVSSRLADDKRNDFRIEAALAKLYASELGWQVTDELMQIRGGRGYETADSLAARGEKPVPVEQMMRDMRINRIFEGSSEIMHLLIAREALDKHLEVAGDILEPDVELKDKAKAAVQAGAFYSKWLPSLVVGKGQAPKTFDDLGDLAEHARFAERASRKLARSIFYGMSRWQAKMEKKQAFLGRVVDIGAELFGIASATVYAQTIASEQPARAQEAEELAHLFCRQARARVERLFHLLWHNDDDPDYKISQKILEGNFTWLEDGVVDPSGSGPLVAEQPEEVQQQHAKGEPAEEAGSETEAEPAGAGASA